MSDKTLVSMKIEGKVFKLNMYQEIISKLDNNVSLDDSI